MSDGRQDGACQAGDKRDEATAAGAAVGPAPAPFGCEHHILKRERTEHSAVSPHDHTRTSKQEVCLLAYTHSKLEPPQHTYTSVSETSTLTLDFLV